MACLRCVDRMRWIPVVCGLVVNTSGSADELMQHVHVQRSAARSIDSPSRFWLLCIPVFQAQCFEILLMQGNVRLIVVLVCCGIKKVDHGVR